MAALMFDRRHRKCEAEGAKHESTIHRWLGWIWARWKDIRLLRKILSRASRVRQCRGCGRAGGAELAENGCPTCGPDAEIS